MPDQNPAPNNAPTTLADIDLSGGTLNVQDPVEPVEPIEPEPIEPQEPQEPEEPEDTVVSNIAELAESLGVDASQLYDLHIPLQNGTDGESVKVTISELKDAYQKQQLGTDSFAEERQTFEAEKAQFHAQQIQLQGVQQQANEAIQQVDTELAQIEASFSQIDWSKFEQENPAEAVLQRQKFDQAYAHAQQRKKVVVGEFEGRQQQAQNEYMMGQQRQTLEMIPEWKDKTVFESERVELRSFLHDYY